MKNCLLLIPALALAGCSGDSFEVPPVHAVTGTVTFNGSPVEGATIQFVPKSGANGPKAAKGKTDSSGQYTLSTYFSASVEEEGAMLGEYKVLVSKMPLATSPIPITPPEGLSPEEQTKYVNEQMAKGMARKKRGPAPKSELPNQYRMATKSPLTATIAEGGGSFDFDLTSK